jgi:hypothetical protein
MRILQLSLNNRKLLLMCWTQYSKSLRKANIKVKNMINRFSRVVIFGKQLVRKTLEESKAINNKILKEIMQRI